MKFKQSLICSQAALEQRLREINMNEFEAQKYIRYVAPVQFEIKQLRAILEAAQAKVRIESRQGNLMTWCRARSASGVAWRARES